MRKIIHLLVGNSANDILEYFHNLPFISCRISVRIENFLARIRRKTIRFRVKQHGNIFAIEGKRELLVNDYIYGFWSYRNGIQFKADKIFDSYCLDKVVFGADDVVFDCGANSGDLFLRLSQLIDVDNYYAFEPSPSDFKALTYNLNGQGKLYNVALGNRNSEMDFYLSIRGADSSLIPPRAWEQQIKVDVIRLDSFCRTNSIESIKLLKVEAEGYEPEVLDGFGEMIRLCEFVAVDGGPERGVDCVETLSDCTNLLLSNGFIMIGFYPEWTRALYKRV
jgi:FkbM family methyltransferase